MFLNVFPIDNLCRITYAKYALPHQIVELINTSHPTTAHCLETPRIVNYSATVVDDAGKASQQ